MLKKPEKNLIVGLDIGTTKVVAIVADVCGEGTQDIIGVGTALSSGVKKGVVVNIESTVQAIKAAIEEAEYMAGCKIHSVYVGISASHIHSINSEGIVAIRDHEVSSHDIERVIEAAKAVVIPQDQKILHILPQEFMIDNQTGIHSPLGMSGVRLEARVHIVTGSISAAQNIVTCVRRSGLEIDDIILSPLASSYSDLTEDEKQLGVCLIDIGGGTTDIAVYVDGVIQHTAVLPVAGDQVTNDIAVALRIPTQNAELIKIQHGSAKASLIEADEFVEVTAMGDKTPKQISKTALAEVVEPRFEELFTLVVNELRHQGLEGLLGAGVVLTGGSARMQGVLECAEQVFKMPVRLGVPRHVSGLVDVVENPIYSTAVGLLQYGYHNREQRRAELNASQGLKGVVGRVKNWFQGNF